MKKLALLVMMMGCGQVHQAVPVSHDIAPCQEYAAAWCKQYQTCTVMVVDETYCRNYKFGECYDGIGLPTQECIQSLSTATCLDLGPTGTEACHLKPVAFP